MGERIRRRGEAMGRAMGTDLPEGAKDVQSRLREELRRKGMDVQGKKLGGGEKGRIGGEKGIVGEDKEGEEEKELGILQRLWIGGEGRDWKKKRDQREKEALEEGKGYGDLIMDQIWEVWNRGEKKMEEVKERDEKVLEEERKRKESKK